jgi:predicted dehydrogenase
MSDYSKTYRVGLVGSGGIARAHGTACQALDGADLTAICDVSQDALDRYGEQFWCS